MFMKRPESYRGLITVGWGRIFPMTKWEKRRLDEAADFAEKLLAERISERKVNEMEEDLFTEIRDALEGVKPIVALRSDTENYQVSRSFDQQVSASISSGDEVLYSLTVSRRDGGVAVRHYEHYKNQPSDYSDRTTEQHGEDVVRAFVLQFIRHTV